MELIFGGRIPLECEEIERTFPSSFRLVPHNMSGIPATLWLTLCTGYEEFVSLNEDPYKYILMELFSLRKNSFFLRKW